MPPFQAAISGDEYNSVKFFISHNSKPNRKVDCIVYPSNTNMPIGKNTKGLAHLTEGGCKATALKIRRYVRRIVAFDFANESEFVEASAYGTDRPWRSDYQSHRFTMYENSGESTGDAFFEAFTAVEYQPNRSLPTGVPADIYEAKENDSLWGIAKENYGDGAAWPLLYDFNSSMLTNPENLRAGDIIFLPTVSNGWKEVKFKNADAKLISIEAYGTNNYELLVKTLCKPFRSESKDYFSCILPVFGG